MAVIKIHELPLMEYEILKDSDCIAIENQDDTWHIPIEFLRVYCSNDHKISAIYDQLMKAINDLKEETAKTIMDIKKTGEDNSAKLAALTQSLNALNYKVTNIEASINNINNSIYEIIARLDRIENHLNTVDVALDDHNDRLNDHDTLIQNNITNISSVTNTAEQNKVDIIEIFKMISKINNDIDNQNAVSMDTINNLSSELKELIINKYNELMELIDECHHQEPIIV